MDWTIIGHVFDVMGGKLCDLSSAMYVFSETKHIQNSTTTFLSLECEPALQLNYLQQRREDR